MNGALAIAAVLVPTIRTSLASAQTCANGKVCSSEEYCSTFTERCEKCGDICDPDSHNYHESDCKRYCTEYGKEDWLRSQVRAMQHQQNVILIILLVLLILIVTSHAVKIIRWLKKKRCMILILKKFSSKNEKHGGKDQAVGTISNVMHMNETERAPSQIYSVTGIEGSTVQTVTTPVSTRYPAEDSTTTTEYSYDNAGLQVTPSSNKQPPSFPHVY